MNIMMIDVIDVQDKLHDWSCKKGVGITLCVIYGLISGFYFGVNSL